MIHTLTKSIQHLAILGRRSGRAADEPTIFDDDLFIVSYPKSGNTWMRFILANLLKGEGGDPIDFHSAVQYVPEYEVHTDAVMNAKRPRVLKSHRKYDPRFGRVVYLVRDVRDVYVSYFHYLKKRLPEGMTLSAFLRWPALPPCHWHEHVASWIDRPNVLVIRYEDMLDDAAGEVRRLVDHWPRRDFSDEAIHRAIAASSFDRMKSLEATNGRPFRDARHKAQSTTFMRKGIRGDWATHLSEDDAMYLYKQSAELFDRLGYEAFEQELHHDAPAI